MNKSALIVDDSKTARIVLKRMLEVHELDVATVESAESALQYLNDHRPDVIFMDHLMPGMDGFEAVTAIKNNPDTATIPIMMYTSQQGEVYVGQARALGAVGVLPKEVEPVEVSKVLESLRVIGQRVDREKRAAELGQTASSGEFPELEKFDRDLRELIRDLFEQQRGVIRRDLLDSYEAIAARVADEIRTADADGAAETERLPNRKGPAYLQIALAVMAVVIVALAWLNWHRDRSWQRAREQNATELTALRQQRSTGMSEAAERGQEHVEQRAGQSFQTALETIAWAVNNSAEYSFGEIPLDDKRLSLFEGLTGRLLTMGFSGQVIVETYVGDFCMVGGGPNGFVVAPDDLSVVECDKIGQAGGEAFNLGMRQSVAFANFVNIVEEQTGGRIRFVIVSRGNETPLVAYPPAITGITAGMWNDMAETNNRVEITLLPDPY